MKLSVTKYLAVGLFLLGSMGLYGVFSHLGLIFSAAFFPNVLCGDQCSSSRRLHQPPTGDAFVNSDRKLAALTNLFALKADKLTLLIEKSKFRLTVYYNQQPLKFYPIVSGNAPTGDKLREGDRKTPEGLFQIQDKYPHPSWSKFLWVNYPTADSWRKHLAAKHQGKLKISDTIGSEIGIHGFPRKADQWIDDRSSWGVTTSMVNFGLLLVMTHNTQEF